MVKDKVAEAEWQYLDVNEHWQQMKNNDRNSTLSTGHMWIVKRSMHI